MKKESILFLSIIFFALCYFTIQSFLKVLASNWELPQTDLPMEEDQTRIILLTKDIDTPFWNKVAQGAKKQAEKEGIQLEVWGSYNNNTDEFLRKLDIAIYSKVDGIIAQGLDTEEFKELIKTKASSNGIPVITVANDVPMEESLRRTYVGPNQYLAGKMIAEQLVRDMGTEGTVAILYDGREEHYQLERLRAMEDVFNRYPGIKFQKFPTSDVLDHVVTDTQNMLNHHPDVDAIIVVDSKIIGTVIHEVAKRFQIEPFYIYSFEDDNELASYLERDQLDGYIEQTPEKMGTLSVNQMMEWLKGNAVPLNKDGYFTEIQLVKAKDRP